MPPLEANKKVQDLQYAITYDEWHICLSKPSMISAFVFRFQRLLQLYHSCTNFSDRFFSLLQNYSIQYGTYSEIYSDISSLSSIVTSEKTTEQKKEDSVSRLLSQIVHHAGFRQWSILPPVPPLKQGERTENKERNTLPDPVTIYEVGPTGVDRPTGWATGWTTGWTTGCDRWLPLTAAPITSQNSPRVHSPVG
eukprot:g53398.t1